MTTQPNQLATDEITGRKAICATVKLRLNLGDFEIIEDKFDTSVNKILGYFGRGIATAYQGMTTEDRRQKTKDNFTINPNFF